MTGTRNRKKVRVINGVECLSAQKLAEDKTVGMHEQHIRKLARDGVIPGHLVGNQWFFDPAQVKKRLVKASEVVELGTAQNDIYNCATPDISDEALINDPLFGL